MRNGRSQPKLNKAFVARQQGFDIYAVNAFAVRDLSRVDEEFTNFAVHSEFPDLIPEREIWLAEWLAEDEGVFYMANALTRLKLQERGRSKETAYEAGLRVERLLRERLSGLKYRNGRPHKRVPQRIYAESYLTLPDPRGDVHVRLVVGNLVRCLYKTDYTEGGHGDVYRWVPRDEIWVEKDIDAAEIPYIVAHEYTELRLMRDKSLEYDRAHDICSQVEFALRRGKPIRNLLTRRPGKLLRSNLPALTSPEYFEAVLDRFVRSSSVRSR